MSRYTKKDTSVVIEVDMYFDPPIGPTTTKKYGQMSDRCSKIAKQLGPLSLGILFSNPYAYGFKPVKKFTFSVDEKIALPKEKRKLLRKIFKSRAMKNLGLIDFTIRRKTTEATTTTIVETLLEDLTES